ncbi:MAG: hypothetical protein ACP5LP_03310 [Candidatus Micrarchaeia archaeon]
MDDKKKKLLYFLGAIFVFLMFISSYMVGGSGSPLSSTTTTIPQSSYRAVAIVNATVVGYGNSITISANTLSIKKIEEKLNSSNYKIENISNNTIKVYTRNSSNIESVEALAQGIDKNASMIGNLTISLPDIINASVYGNIYPIFIKNNVTSISMNIMPVGSKVEVWFAAMISKNGSVVNNQIYVSQLNSSVNQITK